MPRTVPPEAITTGSQPGAATEAVAPWLARLAEGDLSVYAELKRLAANYLRHERAGHTLQATALVHEAYLKLSGQRRPHWQDRAHFFAMASRIMRRILTDHARQHRALKRGAGQADLPLEEVQLCAGDESVLLQHLDEALHRLASFAPRQSLVVELRFYGGMTEREIAHHLAICERTVKRDWMIARAWLHGELNP
ncbi:MAG: sigma-70 family RNA polymerase sigma factor [Bryobacteraceae bacterium]|nr:sigma-70 family RNA polymerase sigma factor [Bryobacteraceae bacterium]